MDSEKIHRGFHRLGAVIGVPIALFGAFITLSPGSNIAPDNRWPVLIGCLIAGAVLYALCRALGWIIAGFAGD